MWPMTVVAVIATFFSRTKSKIIISDHTNLTASRDAELKVSLTLLRFTIAIFYRFADAIITVSKGVQTDISRLGLLDKKLISVIYNPSALMTEMEERYNNPLNELGWKSKFKYKILAVGSLIKQKNFSNLIKAFSLMPRAIRDNSQLMILGRGH